jgi:hypothetical protein
MIVREVAGHDPARFDEVMSWALREIFLTYEAKMKVEARRSYEAEVLVWATLAPHQKNPPKAPDLPKILRDPFKKAIIENG